jgi:hypothetical protein
MRIIALYSGRFQPGHKGHKASYDYLANKFGAENVYVATSDVTAPVTNPFSFSDKVEMLTKIGIPASHIVQVRNPYQAQEITKDIPDPDNTALVFAVSEKDMGENPRFKFGIKKNGDPSYMQPYPKEGKLQPLTKHAYVMVTPTTIFKVKGKDADSASTIRKMYTDGNVNDRKQILHDLYGSDDPALHQLFDKKLGVAKKTRDIVIQQPDIDGDVIDQPKPVIRNESKEHKAKIAKLVESTVLAERTAAYCYRNFKEDLIPNYIDEKSGRKFY